VIPRDFKLGMLGLCGVMMRRRIAAMDVNPYKSPETVAEESKAPAAESHLTAFMNVFAFVAGTWSATGIGGFFFGPLGAIAGWVVSIVVLALITTWSCWP
jgi:hypothetical protein